MTNANNNGEFTAKKVEKGDLIRSADWNDAINEIKRLGKTTSYLDENDFKGPLTIEGALNVEGNVDIGTEEKKVEVTIEGDLTVSGNISGNIDAGNITSGTVQLKEYGENNLAYLQARDESSNRNIGLRIITQKEGTGEPSWKEALTIDHDGNLDVSGSLSVGAGEDDFAYLQARDDSSNRNIGLRIRTQKQNPDPLKTDPVLTEALTIDHDGNLKVSGTISGDIDAGSITSGTLTVTDVLTIGDKASVSNREWMTKGMKIGWDTDNLFIGLKNEGNNRNDAVIAWGDNTNDNLRFINTLFRGGKVSENEVMKLSPNGNLDVSGTISGDIDAGSITSGTVQLKGYGENNLAYLQARDESSNRNIGLRIRTQKQNPDPLKTDPILTDALTIDPDGNLFGAVKGPNNEAFRIAFGRMKAEDTDWQQYSGNKKMIFIDVDTSSAGFSIAYYFTSLAGEFKSNWKIPVTTSIHHPNPDRFRMYLFFSDQIGVDKFKEFGLSIHWVAIGS